MDELPVIQKTYDLIKWYVPILNRLSRNYRYALLPRSCVRFGKYSSVSELVDGNPSGIFLKSPDLLLRCR